MRNPLIGGALPDCPIQHVADGVVAVGASDALLANVALLLMPEDGDASILDKSPNARTVTNTGPVTIETDAESPTGYAMDFGSETDLFYLTFSDDAGLKPGTGDFCIETIAYVNNTATGTNCMTGAASGGSTGVSFNFPWFFNTTSGPYAYPPAADMGCNNGGIATSESGVSWNRPAYHHWAWSRSGTTYRLFCDGNEEATGTDSTNIGASNWSQFLIGMWGLTNVRPFGGRVAMFRLTIGAARYTANFSPFALFPKV